MSFVQKLFTHLTLGKVDSLDSGCLSEVAAEQQEDDDEEEEEEVED